MIFVAYWRFTVPYILHLNVHTGMTLGDDVCNSMIRSSLFQTHFHFALYHFYTRVPLELESIDSLNGRIRPKTAKSLCISPLL